VYRSDIAVNEVCFGADIGATWVVASAETPFSLHFMFFSAHLLDKCIASSSGDPCTTLMCPMSAAVCLCRLVFHISSALSFGSGTNSISDSALSARNMPLIVGHVWFSFQKQMIGAQKPPISLYKKRSISKRTFPFLPFPDVQRNSQESCQRQFGLRIVSFRLEDE
jgi:hypothetical protein